MNDVLQFMKSVPPFQFLDDEVLNSVAEKLSLEYYPKDTVILKQDGAPSDFLRIIKKGGVRVSLKLDNGEEVIIDYRGEGDTFGLWSLLEKSKQKTTVIAVDDTLCYLLGKDEVMHLLDTNAVFTEYFLRSHLTKYIDKTFNEMLDRTVFYGGTDRILFTTQVGDLGAKEVITVPESMSIQDAARLMTKKKISSLIISDEEETPKGIVTDRDLREKVVARALDVKGPIKNIMSLPLIRVDATDYCSEAILKMIKHNIHHLLVVRDGEMKGLITNHDFMLLQGGSPLTFAKDIESQQTIEGLAPVSHKINSVVRLFLKEGARASTITKIITELNDRLLKKVLEIAERKLGPPPVPYCWIVFGSEGRKEQTFRTDQDNAIIFTNPASDEELVKAEAYFSAFSGFVRDSLLKCGFPPCLADYMASNPKWCQPLRVWEKYFHNWIANPTPEAVLRSLIFFDFRPLYGQISLAADLRSFLNKTLVGQNIFLARMASVITANRPPLGFFKTFIVERGGEHKDEINLKLRGVGPLVDIVRLFALEVGISETSTLERISALKDKHPIIIELGGEIEQAFEFMILLRIHHQIGQIENNLPPDNFINPGKLSNLEKKSLKESFQVILKIQDAVADLYRPGMVT